MPQRFGTGWNAETILSMYSKGKYFFNNIVQRSLVWEPERKSNLIHSMIDDYPIPPFYTRQIDNGTSRPDYDYLDGKQRVHAIVEFMEDKLVLKGCPLAHDPETDETVDINGLTYSQLSEEMKKKVRNYSFNVQYFTNLSDEEVRLMFNKLNSGKPLTAKERNIANCVDISSLSEIAKHQLFEETYSERDKDKRKQIPILVKMYMMLNKKPADISFISKSFNESIVSIQTTEEERKELVAVLDKFYAVYLLFDDTQKVAAKKMMVETHFVSLVPFFKRAIDENIPDELVRDFIVSHFNGKLVMTERYRNASHSSSAQTSNIIIRNEELEVAWNNFFAKDEADLVPVQEEEESGEAEAVEE